MADTARGTLLIHTALGGAVSANWHLAHTVLWHFAQTALGGAVSAKCHLAHTALGTLTLLIHTALGGAVSVNWHTLLIRHLAHTLAYRGPYVHT